MANRTYRSNISECQTRFWIQRARNNRASKAASEDAAVTEVIVMVDEVTEDEGEAMVVDKEGAGEVGVGARRVPLLLTMVAESTVGEGETFIVDRVEAALRSIGFSSLRSLRQFVAQWKCMIRQLACRTCDLLLLTMATRWTEDKDKGDITVPDKDLVEV